MSDRELKPCPFCAGPARIVEGTGPFYGRAQVECAHCRIATFWYEEEVAVYQWNRRAPAAAPTIPEGWALVPNRPDQAMCVAGQHKAREWPRFPLRIAPIFQAMLDAAPKLKG